MEGKFNRIRDECGKFVVWMRSLLKPHKLYRSTKGFPSKMANFYGENNWKIAFDGRHYRKAINGVAYEA